jgi:hypothetical protein
MLKPWRDAIVGNPVLVRTIELEPSYWIVPTVLHGKILGYIEVDPDGSVLGHAYFYQSSDDLQSCPNVVTQLNAEEAYRQAEAIRNTYFGTEFSEPIFVHDDSHDRLAWMIEIRIEGEVVSRVFVTPGYVYQRKLGEKSTPQGRETQS